MEINNDSICKTSFLVPEKGKRGTCLRADLSIQMNEGRENWNDM